LNINLTSASGGTAPLLGTTGIDNFNRGNKFFELSNHLGNVLVTVSDRKVGQNPVNGLYTTYTAEVVSTSDYAPGGMEMPGRKYSMGSYGYGFIGKEKVQEIGNDYYDFGSRLLDTRLGGRWFSVDPLSKKFTGISPYSYCVGNPIYLKDTDGKDVYVFDKNSNIVAVIRTSYKDVAIQIDYNLKTESKAPVIQKTNQITYSGHNSYEDAFVVGISYSRGNKVSVVGGVEIVLFTRGPDAGKPQVYGYGGVSTGISKGSSVSLSVSALNLYKPYGMIDDMLDKRTKADDKDVVKESYEGPFFTTQIGFHNTIYATSNSWPAPFGEINWFGEGVTPTSLAINASATTYRLIGPLLNSSVGKILEIDKTLQEKIDAFNKKYPKESNTTEKQSKSASSAAPAKN
jgi:RHS repeat-associated protein